MRIRFAFALLAVAFLPLAVHATKRTVVLVADLSPAGAKPEKAALDSGLCDSRISRLSNGALSVKERI